MTYANLIVTGSVEANLSGRSLLKNDSFWVTSRQKSLDYYRSRAYTTRSGIAYYSASYPYNQAISGAIADMLPDYKGWGLDGTNYGDGYLFSTTGMMLRTDAQPITWAVTRTPSTSPNYLPPVWSSDIANNVYVLIDSNVYHVDGNNPVIAVWDQPIQAISYGVDPTYTGTQVYTWPTVAGTWNELSIGSYVYVLLTGQIDDPTHHIQRADNGLWKVTCTSNSAPSPPPGYTTIGPRTYLWERPSDWGDFLAAFDNSVSSSNSRVEVYAQTYTPEPAHTTPGTFGNPSALSGIWTMTSADGLSWSRYDNPSSGYNALPTYPAGAVVYGNDGQPYTTASNAGPSVFSGTSLTCYPPNPVSQALTPNPWAVSAYPSGTTEATDTGKMSYTITTKIGVSLNRSSAYNGTLVDLYACANGELSGQLVASNIPSYTNPTFYYSGGPESNYVEFDYFLSGDGKQNYLDFNPVRYQWSMPSGTGPWHVRINGVTSSGTFTSGSHANFGTLVQECLGTDYSVLTFGCVVGKGAQQMAVYGMQFILFAVDASTGTAVSIGSMQGSSLAAYKNVYQTWGGNPLTVTANGVTYTTSILPSFPTAAEVTTALEGAVTAGALSGFSAVETGESVTITIRSDDPWPTISGAYQQSPWRYVAHLAGGDFDSYYPTGGKRAIFLGNGYRGRNAWGSGGIPYPETYLGNNTWRTITGPWPPSQNSADGSWRLGFFIPCQFTQGALPPGNIAAGGTDLANDTYKRVAIAIDNLSGGTQVAYTEDAGGSWQTHNGPSGSLPSIVVDQRSNTFILAVNSGGNVHLYRNPNADWSSATGQVTGAVVAGHSGFIAGEPNNQRHLLLVLIDGSNALKLYESFDAGDTFTLKATVEASGMDSTRGFAARIRWLASRVCLAYSVGTQITFASSTDGGTTFTKTTVVSGDTYKRVALDVGGAPGTAGILSVYARDSGGTWHLWQSGDLGATWTAVVSSTLPQPPTDTDVSIGRWQNSQSMVISGANVTA